MDDFAAGCEKGILWRVVGKGFYVKPDRDFCIRMRWEGIDYKVTY